jgi:hypothetical protein
MGDIFEVKGDIDEIRAGFLFYGRNPEYKGELSIYRQNPTLPLFQIPSSRTDITAHISADTTVATATAQPPLQCPKTTRQPTSAQPD